MRIRIQESDQLMTQQLSPAAQAVLAAANGACCYGPDDVLNDSRWITAAALRAAADQVVPREKMSKDPLWQSQTAKQRQDTRAYLLAIAAELESQ